MQQARDGNLDADVVFVLLHNHLVRIAALGSRGQASRYLVTRTALTDPPSIHLREGPVKWSPVGTTTGRRKMDGSRPATCSAVVVSCAVAGSLSGWGASGWGVASGVLPAPVPHDTEPNMFANQDHNIGWNLNSVTRMIWKAAVLRRDVHLRSSSGGREPLTWELQQQEEPAASSGTSGLTHPPKGHLLKAKAATGQNPQQPKFAVAPATCLQKRLG